MTRVVLDANILLSAYATSGTPNRALRSWPERYELYVSAYIINEVRRVFTEPYFSRRITPQEQGRYIAQLESAHLIDLTIPVSGVATQPKDDPILATAHNARADYLVTGDRALLDLGTFEGTRIVTAADFVAILEASQGDTAP